MKKNSREAKLVPGSLYTKENSDFIRETMSLSQDLFNRILSDPSLKNTPLRKKAEKIYDNMMSLSVEIRYRREKGLEDEKLKRATEEGGAIFSDRFSEEMMIWNIGFEDARLFEKVQ